jgi:hypothetical protein
MVAKSKIFYNQYSILPHKHCPRFASEIRPGHRADRPQQSCIPQALACLCCGVLCDKQASETGRELPVA